MIALRMKIGDGGIVDSHDEFGMIYLSADNVFSAPEKQSDSTAHYGEPGEHIDRRAVLAAFDYKVQVLIEAPNRDMESANAKIRKFNEAIREGSGAVRRRRNLTLYSDYKRVKICGVSELISEATDFYRRADGSVMDCVKAELKLRVENPELCDFDKPLLAEDFGLKDTEQRWWGFVDSSRRYLYSATDTVPGRTVSVCARVSPGDRVLFGTYVEGDSTPTCAVVNNLTNRRIISYIARRNQYWEDEVFVNTGGVFVINVNTEKVGDGFYVNIRRKEE